MAAIINNVAYSWSMIRISIPALDISEDSTIMQGVSEIKWNKVRKIENNYGIGGNAINRGFGNKTCTCLLYTSPSPRDRTRSRMPSSA